MFVFWAQVVVRTLLLAVLKAVPENLRDNLLRALAGTHATTLPAKTTNTSPSIPVRSFETTDWPLGAAPLLSTQPAVFVLGSAQPNCVPAGWTYRPWSFYTF